VEEGSERSRTVEYIESGSEARFSESRSSICTSADERSIVLRAFSSTSGCEETEGGQRIKVRFAAGMAGLKSLLEVSMKGAGAIVEFVCVVKSTEGFVEL
jgi:hypothetical protein